MVLGYHSVNKQKQVTFFMTLSLTTFLIVCPMVFLAGFVDAIGGGGGLISLPAYLFAGLPAHMAVATNKLSSATGTLVSTARFVKNGHVDWPLAIPGILAALLGSSAGANISLLVSERLFQLILIVVLPVVALYIILRKDLEPDRTKLPSRPMQFAIVIIASFLIGMYDGIYGPGTGTFLILIYTGLAKMDVLTSAGNTKLANLTSNISSLVIFLTNGLVLIPLGLAAGVFSIAGHYVGAGIAMKNGSKFVRIIILCVIGLLMIKVVSGYVMG